MAGDSYLAPNDTTGVATSTASTQTSTGVGSAGKILALNSAGNVDITALPPGVGPGVYTIISSENLAAGDLVNIYSNAGVATARKADASAANASKQADGFVVTAVTSPANATVYPLGEDDTAVTGLTVGRQWLSGTTPGKSVASPPSTSGYLVQQVGMATAATNLVTSADGALYVR